MPWEIDLSSPITGSLEMAESVEWEQRISDTMLKWARDPSSVEDIGIDGPSEETICQALELANRMKRNGLPAPTRIVPDAGEGIVFERKEKACFEKCHFWGDGTVEYLRFQDARLVERRRL